MIRLNNLSIGNSLSKRHRRGQKKRRQRTFALQEGLCYYCGRLISFDNWTIDHMNPISRRGSRYSDNRIGSCDNCNRSKGNMTVLEFLQTDYLSLERRAALGMTEPPIFRYKHAKHRHNERIGKMINESFLIRLSRWGRILWQKMPKLNWLV